MPFQDITQISISPTASFQEVLSIIDEFALGFVLVVDEGGHLVGTITDGDVRRTLMQKGPSVASAAELMNVTPRTLGQDSTLEERQSFLTRNKITFVPIVDASNRVLTVAVSTHLPGKVLDDVAVVVMAGGLGSRLGELTQTTPKPLLEVDGEPILEKIVKRFRDEGLENFIFCVNYKADMIRDYFQDGDDLGVKISYVEEEKKLGTGGALSLVDVTGYNHLFVTNADILCTNTYRDMLEFHIEQSSIATMAVREHSVQIPFGVVETEGFEIKSLREKPTYTHFINAGYYVLDCEAVEHVPADEFFDMPSLFDVLHEKRKRTRIFPTQGAWIDIGRPEDLERARTTSAKGTN